MYDLNDVELDEPADTLIGDQYGPTSTTQSDPAELTRNKNKHNADKGFTGGALATTVSDNDDGETSSHDKTYESDVGVLTCRTILDKIDSNFHICFEN